jgi:uncharacterized membrane protein YgaE (UPF0421/DUF939 family)
VNMNRMIHKFRSEQKLGLRIIKTGIAVTVCVAASAFLKLDQPYLAVIATVLSMGKSVDTSVRAGKNKMIGVLIGSALGCGLAMISRGNAGLCGVGVIILLYLCQLLHLTEAATLTCFAFAAVMFSVSGKNPWNPAIMCAENAILGIAVAVVINLLIIPPNYAEEIEIAYASLKENVEVALSSAAGRKEIEIKKIEKILERLCANIRLYVSEAKLLRSADDEVFAVSCKVTGYRELLDELKAIELMHLNEKETMPEEIVPVYEYHLERARSLQESLKGKEPNEENSDA